VSSRRWNEPWTAPRGLAPDRPPGELSPGGLALLHIGFFFGTSAVGSLVTAAVGRSEPASVAALLLLSAVAAGAGMVVRTRATSTAAWLSDLLLFTSVGYLAGGAGTWAHVAGWSDEASYLTAAVVALPWALAAYVLHRRLWTQVAAVVTVAATLHAAFELRPELPRAAAAAYLLIVASFLALLAAGGLARPVRSAYVLSALLATAGGRVLVDEHAVLGSLVSLAVLALVAAGVLRTGDRSLLPVALLSGLVLGPPVLQPLLGTAQAIGLSMALAAAGAAWLVVDVSRRAVRPVHVGGVFAACLATLLVSLLVLIGDGRHEALVDLVHAVSVAAFFAAAATVRRRSAAVISGLLLLQELPAAVAPGEDGVVRGLVSLAALAAVVLLTIRLRTWQPRAAAAPDQQDVVLSEPGLEWPVVAPYAQVFDALVATLGESGLALQLVDRAAGRLVVGDPVRPTLVVAVWGFDELRTQVRAVGALQDAERLRAGLDAWLARSAPVEPGYASS